MGSRILLLVMLMSIESVCLGTTIVALRTKACVAIASDGVGTFKGGGKQTSRRSVQKIFHKHDTVFAVGGLVRDVTGNFDVAKSIENQLKVDVDLRQIGTRLETLVAAEIKMQLSRLQTEEPQLFKKAIEDATSGTNIVLARWENKEPTLVAINFAAKLSSQGTLEIRTKRITCPGRDCPTGTYSLWMGHAENIEKYIAKNSLPFPAEKAARFLVQLEIDSGTPDVGPPISLVRLDESGITWLSKPQGEKKDNVCDDR